MGEELPEDILGLFDKSLSDKLPSNIITLNTNTIDSFLTDNERVFILGLDSSTIEGKNSLVYFT